MLILSKSLRTVLTSIGADLIQSRRDLQNAFSDMNTRRTEMKGDSDKVLRPSIRSKSHKIFSPKCRSRPTDGGQEEEAVNCWTFRRFLLICANVRPLFTFQFTRQALSLQPKGDTMIQCSSQHSGIELKTSSKDFFSLTSSSPSSPTVRLGRRDRFGKALNET